MRKGRRETEREKEGRKKREHRIMRREERGRRKKKGDEGFIRVRVREKNKDEKK